MSYTLHFQPSLLYESQIRSYLSFNLCMSSLEYLHVVDTKGKFLVMLELWQLLQTKRRAWLWSSLMPWLTKRGYGRCCSPTAVCRTCAGFTGPIEKCVAVVWIRAMCTKIGGPVVSRLWQVWSGASVSVWQHRSQTEEMTELLEQTYRVTNENELFTSWLRDHKHLHVHTRTYPYNVPALARTDAHIHTCTHSCLRMHTQTHTDTDTYAHRHT